MTTPISLTTYAVNSTLSAVQMDTNWTDIQTAVNSLAREAPTSIMEFAPDGLLADGVSDWQTVFEAAAASTSRNIYIPPGKYLLSGGDILVDEKRFYGSYIQNGSTWADAGENGSVIFTKQTTNPTFILRHGGVIEGLQFFYPDQTGSGISAASYPTVTGNPITYAPSIATNLGAANWAVKDCVFLNSYECISVGDPAMLQGTGRGIISGCSAFVIKYFMRGYNLLDQVIVTDFTLSPGIIVGDDTNKQNLYSWALQNARAFEINKSDGLQIDTGIIYGVDLGFSFIGTLAHSLMKIRGVTFDGSRRFIDSVVTLSGLQISDCQLLCNTKHAAVETYVPAIYLHGPSAPQHGGIQIDNLQVDQALGEVIYVNGTGTVVPKLTITNFHFMGWCKGIGSPASLAAVRILSTGTSLKLSDGWLYPDQGDTTRRGIHVNGAVRVTIDSVDQEYGGSFANIANTTVARVQNCSSINTAPATEDIVFTNVPTVFETDNQWAVEPTTRVNSSPAFYARGNGTATVTPGSTTQFTTVVFNQDGSYDAGTGVFTVKKPGIYSFNSQLSFSAGTAGDVWVMQLATATYVRQAVFTVPTPATNFSISLNGLQKLNKGDTARINMIRLSGSGNLTIMNDGNTAFFQGFLTE